MVTFNTDSLDFKDDESAKFGTNSDFATRFDSTNNQFEIEDVANATTAYLPQNVSTDLVGGKFAETVSDGKALADDGNVYDTIQEAVDSASSWVKVGAGTFNESVEIETEGLTLEGSGDRTSILGNPAIDIQTTDLTIRTLSVRTPESGGNTIDVGSNSGTSVINVNFNGSGSTGFAGFNAPNCTVINCTFSGPYPSDACITKNSSIVVGCTVNNSEQNGIKVRDGDCVVAYNVVENTDSNPLVIEASDSVVIGNRISSTVNVAINGTDIILAKNRIDGGINDSGTGTVLDSNLTTE